MKLTFKDLEPKQAISKFFDVINAAHGNRKKYVTDSEKKIIAEFLLLPNSKYQYRRFGPDAKKKVLKQLNDSGWKMSYQNLISYLGSLVKKDILYKDEDSVLHLSKVIKPHINNFMAAFENKSPYQITFRIEH